MIHETSSIQISHKSAINQPWNLPFRSTSVGKSLRGHRTRPACRVRCFPERWMVFPMENQPTDPRTDSSYMIVVGYQSQQMISQLYHNYITTIMINNWYLITNHEWLIWEWSLTIWLLLISQLWFMINDQPWFMILTIDIRTMIHDYDI